MARLRSLPKKATLVDIYATYPDLTRPLQDYVEMLMRGPSRLSMAERELISAYVCGLNRCAYCAETHAMVAAEHGIPIRVYRALLRNPRTAPISSALKALLRYVKKMTLTPAKVTDADAKAVYAAGWDDLTLMQTVLICGHFSAVSRVAAGAGLAASRAVLASAAKRLAAQGYLSARALIAAGKVG